MTSERNVKQPVSSAKDPLDTLSINTIRTSGHGRGPGRQLGPPGHADGPGAGRRIRCGSTLLRFDPDEPLWPDRDRFVLSLRPCLDAALLAVAPGRRQVGEHGYETDRRAGRLARRHQEASGNCTAAARAIPSIGEPSGVETTTGPLGQGVGNSVGMAIAERWLAARYNQPGFEPVRLQRLRLCQRRRHDGGPERRGGLAGRPPESSRTCAGCTTTTTSRSKATRRSPSARTWPTRFVGYGWHVVRVADANDLAALEAAFAAFQRHRRSADVDHRPKPHRLGCRRTSKTRTKAHGEPLGEEEIR